METFTFMSESHKYAELIIKARKTQNMAGVWAGAQTGVTLPIPQAQMPWQSEHPLSPKSSWLSLGGEHQANEVKSN